MTTNTLFLNLKRTPANDRASHAGWQTAEQDQQVEHDQQAEQDHQVEQTRQAERRPLPRPGASGAS
ncbi:hypothetical protein ABT390_13175 [Streptomyces aurantiacus]|uniref:Uncharacterized protein n=1 Tax=Streptomyces aurantiacus JA 4570 TaxID=1286094 RepID=S4ALJ0_9ACTN|nr:hypothetical protein [Streptomyces aurantiacus]EPH42317.1 hypothetical protein STRAU_4646 [Streptomyces aurantiacus JA 4570]